MERRRAADRRRCCWHILRWIWIDKPWLLRLLLDWGRRIEALRTLLLWDMLSSWRIAWL